MPEKFALLSQRINAASLHLIARFAVVDRMECIALRTGSEGKVFEPWRVTGVLQRLVTRRRILLSDPAFASFLTFVTGNFQADEPAAPDLPHVIGQQLLADVKPAP